VSIVKSLSAGVLLVLFFAVPAAALQSLGTVQGFITDESGAALPGVNVELRDVERGQLRTAVTNGQGFFAVRSVPSGQYDLTASLSGFQTARHEGIGLLVGQILETDLQLALSGVQETVVVTAEAPLLEVGRGGAAGYVDEQEISSLPISGRDYVQFALLKPTVKVEPQRGGISLSGQRGINSGLTIDGAGYLRYFMSLQIIAATPEVNFSGYIRGGLDWTLDHRMGYCPIDLRLDAVPDLINRTLTGVYRGWVCYRWVEIDVNDAAAFLMMYL